MRHTLLQDNWLTNIGLTVTKGTVKTKTRATAIGTEWIRARGRLETTKEKEKSKNKKFEKVEKYVSDTRLPTLHESAHPVYVTFYARWMVSDLFFAVCVTASFSFLASHLLLDGLASACVVAPKNSVTELINTRNTTTSLQRMVIETL